MVGVFKVGDYVLHSYALHVVGYKEAVDDDSKVAVLIRNIAVAAGRINFAVLIIYALCDTLGMRLSGKG